MFKKRCSCRFCFFFILDLIRSGIHGKWEFISSEVIFPRSARFLLDPKSLVNNIMRYADGCFDVISISVFGSFLSVALNISRKYNVPCGRRERCKFARVKPRYIGYRIIFLASRREVSTGDVTADSRGPSVYSSLAIG